MTIQESVAGSKETVPMMYSDSEDATVALAACEHNRNYPFSASRLKFPGLAGCAATVSWSKDGSNSTIRSHMFEVQDCLGHLVSDRANIVR